MISKTCIVYMQIRISFSHKIPRILRYVLKKRYSIARQLNIRVLFWTISWFLWEKKEFIAFVIVEEHIISYTFWCRQLDSYIGIGIIGIFSILLLSKTCFYNSLEESQIQVSHCDITNNIRQEDRTSSNQSSK